ncbi:hypothetical protein [Burkholderia metallica]
MIMNRPGMHSAKIAASDVVARNSGTVMRENTVDDWASLTRFTKRIQQRTKNPAGQPGSKSSPSPFVSGRQDVE